IFHRASGPACVKYGVLTTTTNDVICAWMLQYTGYAPGFLNCVDFVIPLPYVPRSNAAPGAVEKMLWLKGAWVAYSTVEPVVVTRTCGANWRPFIAICALPSANRGGEALDVR